MKNTKKMLKELIHKGYVEKGVKLSDTDISCMYANMLADEAHIASAEVESEVVPMPEEFSQLIELATRYDRTIEFIDSRSQQLQAEEKNRGIENKFLEICKELGYLITSRDFMNVVNKTGTVHSPMSVEEAVNAMLLLAEKVEIIKENEEESVMKETITAVEKYAQAYANAKNNEDKVQVLYQLLEQAENVVNVHSDLYIKKDALIQFCKDLELKVNNRTSRVDACVLIKHHADKLVDTTVVDTQPTAVDVPVVTPVAVPTIAIDAVWNVNTANAVVHKMMNMAKSNQYISFISDFILESLIAEVLFNKPKKYKDATGKYVENSFTDEQLSLIIQYKTKFVAKYLIPNGKGTGYTIKSFLMAWYYKKVVYRYSKNNTIVDYAIDYKANTVIRLGSGKIEQATAELFDKIDNSCMFNRIG